MEEVEQLHVPGRYPDDRPATDSQLQSIGKFYAAQDIGDLTSDQASALLDYREFARAAVQNLNAELHREEARAAAEEVAVFISRRRALAQDVVELMRARFNDPDADPDTLVEFVAQTEAYEEIEDYFG